MSAKVYLEGGGDGKDLRARCREAFRKLLEKMGFGGRVPRLVACGGRAEAYRDFCRAFRAARDGTWVAMWVDSEEPMLDSEKTWKHLSERDRWLPPSGCSDEHVLLMLTCMETWVAADRERLRFLYPRLRESVLPPLDALESRPRGDVQAALERAADGHPNGYRKGRRAFAALAVVDPETVARYCPSCRRCRRILDERL